MNKVNHARRRDRRHSATATAIPPLSPPPPPPPSSDASSISRNNALRRRLRCAPSATACDSSLTSRSSTIPGSRFCFAPATSSAAPARTRTAANPSPFSPAAAGTYTDSSPLRRPLDNDASATRGRVESPLARASWPPPTPTPTPCKFTISTFRARSASAAAASCAFPPSIRSKSGSGFDRTLPTRLYTAA
eukprot:26893-Pelagococcus_subviridis.AAC.14